MVVFAPSARVGLRARAKPEFWRGPVANAWALFAGSVWDARM